MFHLLPMRRDQPRGDATFEQRIERAIRGWFADRPQGAVQRCGQPRGETEAEQGTHTEDMLTAPTCIGRVFVEIELRFVVTQAIDHVPGFALVGAYHPLPKGRTNIGQMKVDRNPASIVEV